MDHAIIYVAIREMGRVAYAYRGSMVIGSRVCWHKLAFLAILVVGRFGGVAPKSTPVHHGAQNDTAMSSVAHHVGPEGKVVNKSNPGSPPSWRCWSIIRRNIGYHYGRNVQAQFDPRYAADSVNQYSLLHLMQLSSNWKDAMQTF